MTPEVVARGCALFWRDGYLYVSSPWNLRLFAKPSEFFQCVPVETAWHGISPTTKQVPEQQPPDHAGNDYTIHKLNRHPSSHTWQASFSPPPPSCPFRQCSQRSLLSLPSCFYLQGGGTLSPPRKQLVSTASSPFRPLPAVKRQPATHSPPRGAGGSPSPSPRSVNQSEEH